MNYKCMQNQVNLEGRKILKNIYTLPFRQEVLLSYLLTTWNAQSHHSWSDLLTEEDIFSFLIGN